MTDAGESKHVPTWHGEVSLRAALLERFGFNAFREHQEEVCRAAYAGDDVLLVMPTGAGKSLCYQLPVVAHDGARAVIITPLLALIEDQIHKLNEQGIPADRIHSGRSRAESQEACRAWRDGAIKFLFIAPERLAVPGFLEFLELYKPTMVAVDEAHCISCWGHDFRPEYRMLGPRLDRLRPANIIAVTATATPEVQKDIVQQLGLREARIFIHGFRRHNIAIELMSMSPGARAEACKILLRPDERRPAIIYAPTRKLAESTAESLASEFRAAAFHAGLPSAQRQEVQNGFIRGDLEIIVATIAFGMGIDKANVRTVVHTALPSSLEGYYQEIGRAGRDGLRSEAIMMYSPVDKKTHEYFLEINYPDPSMLQQIYEKTSEKGIDRLSLLDSVPMNEVEFNAALEKLWIHSGVTVDEFGIVRQGDNRWLPRYVAQRRHKQRQLDSVLSFATRKRCRMQQFLDHFGDRDDNDGPCGQCDICLGAKKIDRGIDAFSAEDRSAQTEILRELKGSLARSAGQLFRDLFERRGWQRRRFEAILVDLEDRELVKARMSSFEKDGKSLKFKLVELTDSGRVWLHQAGFAPNLAQQQRDLESKKVNVVRRRNQKRRKSSSASR